MAKYFYFLFISISISSNLFSQEANIATEFSQDGILYKSLDNSSQSLTPFKADEKCSVLEYLGKDKYRVRYNKLVGFVDSQYLAVNEEMMDLFFAYQKKMRIETAKIEQKRKKEVQEIIKKNNEERNEKRKEDPLAKIGKKVNVVISKDENKIKEIRQQDSITKIMGEEKKQQTLQELARKNKEAIIKQREEDSVAKVREEEKKQHAPQELARKMQEEIKVSRREDSVAKIIEEEKSKEAQQKLAKENEEEIEEKKEFQDSCHYLMNEYDETYNVRTIKTDPYRVSKNLTIELYEYGQNKQVFFNLSQDLGCASYLPNNRSYVKVTLENDQVITFYHFWDIDCGNFGLKGRLSNSQMMILEKSPIKSILFQGTKDHYEMTNIDYKEFFMDKLKCLD